MSDPYEGLRQAEEQQRQIDAKVRSARQRVKEIEQGFREALSVDRNAPCIAAVLPSGKIVVHVWIESPSKRNQLHIVQPSYYDEEGKPREKFPDEQLGRSNLPTV